MERPPPRRLTKTWTPYRHPPAKAKVAVGTTTPPKPRAEIGEYDLAIDWACHHVRPAPIHNRRPLLAQPVADTPRKRTRDTANPVHDGHLRTRHLIYQAVEDQWPNHREQVMDFNNTRLGRVLRVRSPARPTASLGAGPRTELDNPHLWETLADQYQTIDPAAVLPIYTQIVHDTLKQANAKTTRPRRRLAQMRLLTAGTPSHPSRPTHQRTTPNPPPPTSPPNRIDKAGLPKI